MTPELEQKVLSALPPGEKLVAGFTVSRSLASSRSRGGSSSAPVSRRPRVLVGQEKSGDGWSRFLSRVFRVFTTDVPSQQRGTSIEDPSLRGRRQKDKEPFFGGWDSLAGQFLIAGQPKSKTGAAAVVAVTDVCMRFVYVQYRRVLGGLGTPSSWVLPFRTTLWCGPAATRRRTRCSSGSPTGRGERCSSPVRTISSGIFRGRSAARSPFRKGSSHSKNSSRLPTGSCA